jgi:two-component system OmpR family response regulator
MRYFRLPGCFLRLLILGAMFGMGGAYAAPFAYLVRVAVRVRGYKATFDALAPLTRASSQELIVTASTRDSMTRMRMLVVEDDALLAAALVQTLTQARHTVESAITGPDADRMLRDRRYALVVLDIGLPGIDGFEVLRRLRARDSVTSVIILTARDAVGDKVRGLDMGADDYLTKPFSLNEFEARIRVLLKQKLMPTVRLSVGRLTVDLAARRFLVDDMLTDLTVREWALLEIFLSRPGIVLSKEHILMHLFPHDANATINTIEVYVSRLRAKIEHAGAKIRTIRGFGYIWETEIE